MKDNKPLFGEFKPSSYEDWKKSAEQMLKGAPFDKKMFTNTPEGITLKPIYNADDVPAEVSLPGFGNYLRGTDTASVRAKAWDISQELSACRPEKFNAMLLDALSKGQTSVEIVLDSASAHGKDADEVCECMVGDGALSISTLQDVAAALKDVRTDCVSLNVHTGESAAGIASLIYANAQDISKLSGGVYFDPVGTLAKEGVLNRSLTCAYDEMFALAKFNSQKAPKMGAIGVDTFVYSSAGASAVEELALAMATAVNYLREMLSRGLDINAAAKNVRLRLSLGSNFFMEIAKLRAARIVWAKVVKEFGGDDEAMKLRLNVRTSFFNKTVYDPYVNLLRTATEAFSGAIGMCDSMTVGSFDEVVRKPDDFSARIARNQQIILQEECNLTEVIDPAGGSYYIEALTEEVAKKTWGIFASIEAAGGIVKALESNMVQGMIAKTLAARKKGYDSRRTSVVGTNNYANMLEKKLEDESCCCASKKEERIAQVKAAKKSVAIDLGKDSPADKIAKLIEAAKSGASLQTLSGAMCSCSDKVSVAQIKAVRAVEHFEELRNASAAYKAKNGHGPKLFLATMGSLLQHKARADYIRSFFEVGGFDVIYPNGFENAEAAAKAFADSKAKVAVVCSTDETYPELVPAVTKAIKALDKSATVFMAGAPAPESEASYNEAGLDGSVSVKSNNYETLKAMLVKLGVI